MRFPDVDAQLVPGAALAVVLLHPHPDMGGDRFNHVIDALYRALPQHGFSAARFDFSSSDIGIAAGEAAAVIAACGDGPISVAGYSFGASVAQHVLDPRVAGWLLVAPILQAGDSDIGLDPRPKALLTAEHDRYCPPDRVRALTASWANTTVVTVQGADHFLAGGTEAVVDGALAWLAAIA